MLKLGVFERRAFFAAPPPGLFARLYYLLSKTRISFELLRMPAAPSREDVEMFERLMPYVRLSSGVYRTTHRGRFRNLDPLVNALLAQNFSPSATLRVEDWAASACLTSCEWAKTLLLSFPNLRFVASDISQFLVEMARPGSVEKFVFEPGGHPLQYIRPPFVIRMEEPEPWLLPVNRLLYLHAWRRWRTLSRFATLPDSWMDPLSEDPLERNEYVLRKLPLIHPEALALAREDPRFVIRRHSVFETLEEPCHVIRSMNVFNRSYFSDYQLALGARSVSASLLPGGMWIVGRTTGEEPPLHEAAVFQRQSSGALKLVERIGPGSEIESIIDAANCGS